MIKVSRRTGSGSGDPTERLQSWTAALATALLHGLLVLLVMLAPPITVTPPQEGGAAGSRLQVTYRSEEHTSELQSLMRISYAVFCLKKHNKQNIRQISTNSDVHGHVRSTS